MNEYSQRQWQLHATLCTMNEYSPRQWQLHAMLCTIENNAKQFKITTQTIGCCYSNHIKYAINTLVTFLSLSDAEEEPSKSIYSSNSTTEPATYHNGVFLPAVS